MDNIINNITLEDGTVVSSNLLVNEDSLEQYVDSVIAGPSEELEITDLSSLTPQRIAEIVNQIGTTPALGVNGDLPEVYDNVAEDWEGLFEETTNEEILEETLKELIPTNSGALEVRDTTLRFSDASWFKSVTEQDVTVAGLGGIGSWVALVLSRMWPNVIHLYDDDEVETVNMSGQLYGLNAIGLSKVSATAANLANFSNYHSVVQHIEKYEFSTEPTKIMFCGFDNMMARQNAWASWKNAVTQAPDPENWLFVDGRLAAEELQVFAIQGEDTDAMVEYQSYHLFSDSKAEETLCSFKQTSHVAMMIAGQMVNIFTNFIANKFEDVFPRKVPFYTTYDAELMLYKTVNTWQGMRE